MNEHLKKVCVIGGGVAGLSVSKCILNKNIPVVLYDPQIFGKLKTHFIEKSYFSIFSNIFTNRLFTYVDKKVNKLSDIDCDAYVIATGATSHKKTLSEILNSDEILRWFNNGENKIKFGKKVGIIGMGDVTIDLLKIFTNPTRYIRNIDSQLSKIKCKIENEMDNDEKSVFNKSTNNLERTDNFNWIKTFEKPNDTKNEEKINIIKEMKNIKVFSRSGPLSQSFCNTQLRELVEKVNLKTNIPFISKFCFEYLFRPLEKILEYAGVKRKTFFTKRMELLLKRDKKLEDVDVFFNVKVEKIEKSGDKIKVIHDKGFDIFDTLIESIGYKSDINVEYENIEKPVYFIGACINPKGTVTTIIEDANKLCDEIQENIWKIQG